MNISEITVGTRVSRLDQRVIDINIEKHIFKRHVFIKALKRTRPKPFGLVSFIEEVHFNKYAKDYLDFEPRIVPYYTRAIEPVDHYLIPKMNELGYSVVVTHHPQFKQVNVYTTGSDKPISMGMHERRTIAISIACLSAIHKVSDEDFNYLAETIKK